MILWVFVVLLVAFVVLPFIGAAIWWVIVSVLHRHLPRRRSAGCRPGRQQIGVLGTIASGWIGSLGGCAIAGALWGFKHHHGHWFATVLIEIGIAALAVVIFDLIARKNPPQRTRVEIHHRIIDI